MGAACAGGRRPTGRPTPPRLAARWLVIGAFLTRATSSSECSRKVQLPAEAPLQASDYNGLALPDICFEEEGPHHVFVIGDWGGVLYGPRMPPIPADKRSKLFPSFARDFVLGVDDRAQLLVAEQMRKRATWAPLDYVLNVGDNFYWGGVSAKCGQLPSFDHATGQWQHLFENVYWGHGLEGKPWFGILGNHDYGGYHFTAGWDNTIGYSWGGGSGRWVTVGQYWRQKVLYSDFSVDYFFADTNVNEAWEPHQNPSHNLCGLLHNGKEATCGPQGPRDVYSCVDWFIQLWEEQVAWLDEGLRESKANWQVIVTHFPPKWGVGDWGCLARRYGIDLFLSGHLHLQKVMGPGDPDNPLYGATAVITGGGGGITSEFGPDVYGNDDMYGFVHLTLSKDEIKVEGISHGGQLRNTVVQKPSWGDRQGGCAHPTMPLHFEPADGGVGRACRGRGNASEAGGGSNFILLEKVPTQASCMRHCLRTPGCTGIEFGNKVCEVWTGEISTTAAVDDFACYRVAQGPGGDLKAYPHATRATSTIPKDKALPLVLGPGRQCRGRSVRDRSVADYDAEEAPDLAACEKMCLIREWCTGIEYGPGRACGLWRTRIGATVAKRGVVCIPSRNNVAGNATLVEIGGEVII